ncbi:MAG: hypothetical protein AB8C46_02105 [Burkholderiaceae bacterium]
MELLCLIRFAHLGQGPMLVWEAVEHFLTGLPDASGGLIHQEDLQLLCVFSDPVMALQLLSDTLQAGESEGFAISAALAQGVKSQATLASSLAGFTEGSIETLYDLAATATLQEVAISGKLSSLIKLAAPTFWPRFEAIKPASTARVRSLLVMSPIRFVPN